MGTLFVDKLDPQSGTSLEIGSSGDTITIPSGCTITNNGTQSGFGGTNTPYFNAYRTGNQTGLSDDTTTVLAMDNEYYDSASAYNTSTYRFTPQTAGKYFLWSNVRGISTDDAMVSLFTTIRKNGSAITGASSGLSFENMATRFRQTQANNCIVATANGSSDYFDFTVSIDVASGSNFYVSKDGTNIGGYKIIE